MISHCIIAKITKSCEREFEKQNVCMPSFAYFLIVDKILPKYSQAGVFHNHLNFTLHATSPVKLMLSLETSRIAKQTDYPSIMQRFVSRTCYENCNSLQNELLCAKCLTVEYPIDNHLSEHRCNTSR